MLVLTMASATAVRSSCRDTLRAARAIARSSARLSVIKGSPPVISWSVSRKLLLQAVENVDRDGKDDRRILLRGDLRQGLKIAQLQRGGIGGDDVRRLGQLRRRLELPLCVDDLGPLL